MQTVFSHFQSPIQRVELNEEKNTKPKDDFKTEPFPDTYCDWMHLNL